MRCTTQVRNTLKSKSRMTPRTCVCGFVTTVLVSILRLWKPVANLAIGGCEECESAPRKSVRTWKRGAGQELGLSWN